MCIRDRCGPLDFSAMRAAAEAFVGEHNFRAFTKAERDKDCTRTVLAVHIIEEGSVVTVPFLGDVPVCCEQQSSFVRFRFQGHGFLTHQIRRMVGALLLVGAGRIDPSEIAAALEQPHTAPWYTAGSGLCVSKVTALSKGLWLEKVVCFGDEEGATKNTIEGATAENTI
eukprot:TRINITY_DN28600_c0_g1_i2.p1 TRINITY_DN28600_c0_g1~~TRINITY_DN28600_c0_g1_i2.p1  ORF type:complete len:169 (-),score=34.08 TRINITY_DN28600_c0_g1_i2:15-521(-)